MICFGLEFGLCVLLSNKSLKYNDTTLISWRYSIYKNQRRIMLTSYLSRLYNSQKISSDSFFFFHNLSLCLLSANEQMNFVAKGWFEFLTTTIRINPCFWKLLYFLVILAKHCFPMYFQCFRNEYNTCFYNKLFKRNKRS